MVEESASGGNGSGTGADDELRVRWAEEMIRPLGADAEKKLEATPWLSFAAAIGTPAAMRRAVLRWERSDRRKVDPGLLVAGVFLVLLMFALLYPGGGVLFQRGLLDFGNAEIDRNERRESTHLEGKSEEQKLLMDVATRSGPEGALRLWRLDPGNPLYFAEGAISYDWEKLPPGFRETASEIDPDNSWFDYFGAARKGVQVLRNHSAGGPGSDEIAPDVLLPEAFSEALAMIRNARGKPRFDSYRDEMNRLRIPLLPQANYGELVRSRYELAWVSLSSLYAVAEVIAARAGQLEKAGDVEEFRELREDALAFARVRLASESHFFEEEYDLLRCLLMMLPALDQAGKKLGVDEERPEISRWLAAVRKRWDGHWDRPLTPEAERVEETIRYKGETTLIGHHERPLSSGGLVVEPPGISSEDLEPGRKREYAVCGSKFWWLGFLIAGGMTLVVAVFLMRASREVKLLARRMESVLGPGDRIWVCGAGVLLPLGATLALFWLTPVGGTDFGLRYWVEKRLFLVPSGFYASGILLVFILPVLVARWRLQVRIDGMGFRWRSLTGWMAVAGVIMFMFLFRHPRAGWWSLLGLDFGLIWLLCLAIRAVLAKGLPAITSQAVARAVLPAYVFAMLAFAVTFRSGPFIEQYWFKRDRFFHLTTEAPTSYPYEYRLANRMRKEMREILEE